MRRCLAMLAPCAALAATAATAGCGGPRRTLLVAAPVPGVQDTSATAVSGAANDLLTVLYTADVVMAGAEDPGNFSLESPIGTPVSLAGASLRYDPPARTTAMSLGAGRDLRRGASYRLRVARVRSLAGVEVLPDSGQDGTVGGDAAGPTVLRAVQDTAADPTGATLQLRFDEAVEATTAGSASSYASSGPATASAALLFDAQSVRVRLQSPATPGVTTLAVQGVKDLAGNLMAPATSLAVAAPDTTPPGLAQVAAESVPGGPPDEVRVRYDEPVDAVDAVDAARYALESPTGTPLSLSGAGLSYDTAAQTARLQLSGASLAAGASFQVRVTGVRDVFGNAMGSTAAGGTVTTAFAGLDAEPPRIAGASARSVSGPSNDTVQVVYDEEVDSSAAATLASYRLESPTGAQRDLTGSRVAYDAATRTATITLDAPAGGVTLATGASFTVLVDGVRDAAGNPVYPGTSRAGKVEGDATPPRVTGAVQDLGLDPTARTVVVDFDEAVDAAAAGAPGSYSLGTGGPATVSATPQAGGTRVLLAFASAVLPGRDTLTVKDVRDLAGNVIVTTAQALSSTDGTPPTLAGLAARSASGAANDTVVVTYSEPVVESDAVARSNFVLESPTGTVLDLGTADLRYDAAARATAITLGGGRPVDLRTGASATVRLTAVRDLAGNALAAGAAASSQVAGDATPPAIASSAATAVSGAANDTIAVVYDEDVEAAGASDPASYALEQPTGAARPLATATASYDAATRTATLTLGGGSPVDLSTRAGGDSYTVRVSGVRDLAGNAAAGVSSSGTVGGDRAPPTVARAVQVAPDTVDVAFSEVVSAASVLAAGFAATGGAPATTSATLLAGGTAVRVVFAAAFPGTGTLEVQGVSDLAGNLLAPVAGQPVVGDTTPPALASSSLVTVSGPGNDRVALTYDEDVQPGTATDPANFALESPTGTPLSLAGATLAYDAPARTTRLTLAAPARTGASYTAVVGGVKDTAGNTMAFGTRAAGTVGGDLVAPTVASSSPPGGSSGVATGTPVEVRFSEAMDPASITSSSVQILFGAGSPVAGTLALDASGLVATFTPTAGLAPDATHELAVTTLATDLAGNAATAFTTSFRTAATVLALTAVDPAEGTAAGGQTVTLTGTGFRLGTTVSLGALRATAVEVQSATRIRCLVPAAAAPSASGPVAVDVALARPDGQTAALAGGYRYLADTTSPEVSLVQPVHGANGVRRNQRVVLVYSEPLDPATVIHNGGAGDTVLVYRDSGHPVRPTTDRITGTVALNARGDRLSFTPPGDWGSNKGVRIGLTDGVHDRAGNRLVQGSAGSLLSLGGLVGGQVFESSFRTGNRNDSQAPAVFTYSPAQGATGVSALKVVELTFTEPVDPVTVTTATFRVEKGTSPIAGATALTPDGLVASFTPELALDGATAYTVRLGAGVQDTSGNPLGGTLSAGFTTAGTGPRVLSVDPADGVGAVPVNQRVVTVRLDQRLDVTSVHAASFTVAGASGAALSGTIAFAADRLSATFTAASDLAASTAHTVTLTTEVRGEVGNPLDAAFRSRFTTQGGSDTTPPAVGSVSPSAGATGVSQGATVLLGLSEALDAATVGTATAFLRQGNPPAGAALAAAVGLEGAGADRVRIDPSSDLAAGTTYTVTLTTGVRDLAGNALASEFASSFTTALAAGDSTPPAISLLTLNGISAAFNGSEAGDGTLEAPPTGFSIDLAYADNAGGLGIDTGSLAVVASQPLGGGAAAGGVDAGQDFGSRLTRGALSATLTVGASLAFPAGAHTLRATVRDQAGNLSAEAAYSFTVAAFTTASQPFEQEEVWFLDFAADRSRNGDVANGTPDFQEDLPLYGLRSAAPVAVQGTTQDSNQVVQAQVQVRVLERVRAIYGYSGATKGAVNIRFQDTAPASGGFSTMCVGGGDGTSGTLGRSFVVLNNTQDVSDCESGGTLLGVFTLNAFNAFSGLSAFQALFDGLIATPVGRHADDPVVLSPGFDRLSGTNTSSQNQRYDQVYGGVEALARMAALIAAHEVGHSVGLVADDALPTGLLGGSLGGSTSNHVREGAGDNVMDASISFAETQAALPRLTALNGGYLREVVIRRP